LTLRGSGLLLLALAATPALPPAARAQGGAAAQCAEQGSTYEQSACLERALRAADRELNDVYRQVLATIDADRDVDAARRSAWRASMVRAQRAWIAFRDADCGELTGHEWHGGTGTGPATLACLLDRTAQRSQDLRRRSGLR
jgi:uncharacterized protein YecT (DUF1311 family)